MKAIRPSSSSSTNTAFTAKRISPPLFHPIKLKLTSYMNPCLNLKTVYQSKAIVFSALSDAGKYKQAHELFQSGYTMMQDESDKYQKALNTLQGHGYVSEADMEQLYVEKIDLTGEIDTVKSNISSLKNESRQCGKIKVSVQTIKTNVESYQKIIREKVYSLPSNEIF